MSEDLLGRLKAATKGLRYVSESDRPVKPFVWKEAEAAGMTDPETVLRTVRKIQADTPIRSKTVEEFFAPMLYEYEGQPDEEKEGVRRFRELRDLLKASLTDPRAFRVGDEPDIPAYVLGKTPAGDWAGVETVLVET
ncbi:MAG: nuclease A inhibitor family protein [Capsulimonadales bacterium]|nr:nuclease A inhibitor family protein [Capsulimonadales bacterium]